MFGKLGAFLGLARSADASANVMMECGEYQFSRTPAEAMKIRKAKKKAKASKMARRKNRR